jgi:glycosyltransferase involved in cell wall biosynthesis
MTRVAYFAGTMRPGHDGVTRVLYRLIGYLHQRRISNIFISPIIPSAQERQTEFYSVPSVPFPLYKDYRVAFPGSKHFEEMLRRFNPDILHINSPCSLGYAAVRFANRHQIPVVATYHTHFASYAKYYKIRVLEGFSWMYLRNLYNRCQRVFVPSQPIVDELASHGLQNLECLAHGVDTEVFNPAYRSHHWRKRLGVDSKYVLLFVGRLVWEKDLQTLADAYKILMAKRDDVAFVLVGDGPIRPDLERLMPQAVFLGYQSGIALSTAFASSDLFVFPSTTETFGNVTLEAMASGLPPICASEGGASGIIKPGRTGVLAKPRDPLDLIEKIESLLDHPEKRKEILNEILRFAREQQWEKVFDQMLQSYERIIREYACRRAFREKKAA